MIPNKPYKLSKDELETSVKFPVYCQPKLDGWRIIILNGRALTYKLKPIPNNFIRTTLEKLFKDVGYYLIDGEGLLMDEKATYQDIQSAYASVEGEPDFRYVIFDAAEFDYQLNYPYHKRLVQVADIKQHLGFPTLAYKYERLELIQYTHYLARTRFELNTGIEYFIENKKLEGVILRSPDAPYKYGRSTLKEGGLLAYKPFTDAEAEIIGIYQLEKNLNEQEQDHHGHAKRSSAKANKVKMPMLGGFIVRGLNGRFKGVEFSIGSGFTEEQRVGWYVKDFDSEAVLYNAIVKYKYFEVGSMDKPRMPVFIGFRNQIDL